jgi:hypothetical protein
MAYGKGKGGKGGKVGSGKSKKAPKSRSVRAGLQVRPFTLKCVMFSIVPSWKNSQILEIARSLEE